MLRILVRERQPLLIQNDLVYVRHDRADRFYVGVDGTLPVMRDAVIRSRLKAMGWETEDGLTYRNTRLAADPVASLVFLPLREVLNRVDIWNF